MTDSTPKISQDALYELIRLEQAEEFNRRRRAGERCDLHAHNFRGLDLRKFDLSGLDLSDCYFRQADLRGLDLASCRLEGSSIHDANVAGTLFPKELAPDEIHLSHTLGTRMRYR